MSVVHKYKRLFVVFLFLSILFLMFRLTGLKDHFNLGFVQQQILEHKIWGLLIFTLLFSLGNLIQVPGWLFLAAAVLALGRGPGGVATYIAASISCVVTFFTIRFLGGDALRQMDSKIAVNALRRMDSSPVASVTFLRVLFQTAPVLNYVLAMSGVKFRDYLVGTLLGLPLPILLYCIFFDLLARALNII